jgi:2-dehydro-3-deoxyphosphogluconate aldolase/(4S)-4-hydroxy-2-oxoglutarate aldolase
VRKAGEEDDLVAVGDGGLGDSAILGIVRYRRDGDLAGVLAALRSAGVDDVEVTLDTPGALDAVEAWSREGFRVGVGTVFEARQVRECADAGATFVVGPGLVPDVVTTAQEVGIGCIPGVFTATEILAAVELGVRVVKLFPACAIGPSGIRSLRGPFPDLTFIATGGIGIDDVGAYLESGADHIGLGSALCGQDPPHSDQDLDRIRQRAQRAVEAAGSR